MQEMSDAQLLRDYAEHGTETAFSEIVARHADLVYSAALRQVSAPDFAGDVAQDVFSALASKASPLANQLAGGGSLVGWLYRSTRFAALNHLRDDRRRLAHEKQAMEQFATNAETAPDWDRLRPVLDEAMAGLNDEDREALLLRFFKRHDFHAVGLVLGVSDDTAQKRVSRALEKLRQQLARRGITSPATALSAVIMANAVQAAPAGLAASISSTAVLTGTAFTSTITAAKAIAMTTLQKATIAATLTIVAGAGIHQAYKASQLRHQVQMLQQQQTPLAEQIQKLQHERDDATHRLASLTDEKSRDTELLKLRAEVTALRQTARERAATESTTGVWATRIAFLKQRLDQVPDKRIPEMEFLTDKDWAAATRDADLSSDDGMRQAMRALRSAAKDNFLNAMRDAIQKYAAAANGGDLPGNPAQLAQAINANAALLPSDLAQLKPYFDVPVEDATLERYQFLPPGKVHDNLSDILVKEIAPPVDPEYDTHHEMGLNSGGIGNVNLIADAVAAAAKDYAQANNGQMPSDPAQIADYLKQPLEAALVLKYLPKLPTDAAVPSK
jgi:RNA polymerase sigma factor (sigma-70 family)